MGSRPAWPAAPPPGMWAVGLGARWERRSRAKLFRIARHLVRAHVVAVAIERLSDANRRPRSKGYLACRGCYGAGCAAAHPPRRSGNCRPCACGPPAGLHPTGARCGWSRRARHRLRSVASIGRPRGQPARPRGLRDSQPGFSSKLDIRPSNAATMNGRMNGQT